MLPAPLPKKYAIAYYFLLAVSSLDASWQAIDDFEDGNISEWKIAYDSDPAIPPASVSVVDDPTGSGQGKVLRIDPGMAQGDFYTTAVAFPLPEPIQIPNGEKRATIYFKMMIPLINGLPGKVDVNFGLSGADLAEGEAHSFGDYGPMGRVNLDNQIDIYDNGYHNNVTELGSHDTNTYYEIWIVVDYLAESADFYMKGGTDLPEQTLVYRDAQFRDLDLHGPLDHVVLLVSAGSNDSVKGRDPIYFDDFFIDVDGENIAGCSCCNCPLPWSRIFNLSTRGIVSGTRRIDGLNGSFVISGGRKRLLIRAGGPALAALDVSEPVLEDPILTVVNLSDGSIEGGNDDWTGEAVASASELVSPNFLFASGSKDAALILDLEEGSYSALVTTEGPAGLAIVEVYELE